MLDDLQSEQWYMAPVEFALLGGIVGYVGLIANFEALLEWEDGIHEDHARTGQHCV
jgi:hypothetical protein